MFRFLCSAFVIVFGLIGPAILQADELKPIFHASMDEGKAPGKVGKAGVFRRVDARDKIDLDRGTFACFISFPKAPTIAPWNAIAGVSANRNAGYWSMLMNFANIKMDFGFRLHDVGRYSPALHLEPSLGRWKAGEWRHLAGVWDRNEGMTVYEDGKRIASNWGKFHWYWTPLPDDLFINGNADEVYIYPVPLTDHQIAQLAAGKKPTGDPIALTDASKRRENDLAAYGWNSEALSALPVIQPGAATAIVFAHMTSAFDAKRPVAQVFEGFSDSTWPLDKYGANIRGERLDMTFAPGASYDRVRSFIHRTFDGQILHEVNNKLEKLVDVKAPHATIWHARLPKALQDRQLVLTRQFGNFGQLDFYRVEPLGGSGAPAMVYSFAPADSLPDNEAGLTLLAETPTRFRQFAAGTGSAAPAWTIDAPAFGGFQAVTEPPTDAKAFDGAILNLVVENITEPTPIQIQLKEPVHGRRNWIVAEAVLQPKGAGRQTYTVALKGRPVINMPPIQKQKPLKDGEYSDELTPVPGTPFGIKITAANPLKWHLGSDGTTIAFTIAELERVKPLAVEDQVEFMRSAYSEVMEGHEWGNSMIQLPLTWLCKFAPEHKNARQMYERIGSPRLFHDINVPKLVYPEPKNDTGAPDWAFWQMQAMKEHLRILHWRIDETQLRNGEFGGVWNDDADHVENWLGYTMCMDDDDKIKNSLRKFWDGNWQHLDQGVGRYVQDACHYYEEGMGGHGMRLMMDYGDPMVFNRAMTTCSHYDKWLVKSKTGRLVFASEYISLNEMWLDREFNLPELRGHRLDLLVPAGYLIWYNHQPKLARMVKDLDYGADAPDPKAPPSRTTGDSFIMRTFAEVDDLAAMRKEMAIAAAAPVGSRAKETNGLIDEVGVTDAVRKAHFVDYAEPGPIAHYWGAKDTDLHWLRFRVSGDTRWMVDSYKRVCEWFYSHDWLNAQAMPSLDRNPLPRYSLIRARIGSLVANRGSSGLAWPRHAISYTKGANDVAALFTDNVDDRFSVRFYPFTEKEHEIQLRVWRLLPGTYKVTLASDKNDDGKGEETLLDKEMTLERGAYMDLKLPPKQASILTVAAIKTRPFDFDRPDPAISASTCDLNYKEHLIVKVYNLGNKPAENVLVRVRDGHSGALVMNGEVKIDRIEAPVDLKPRYRAAEFKNINATTLNSIIIEIDPEKTIDDLNPYNNRYELRY